MHFSFLPLWALFGLLAAGLSATQMLLQEHLKAPPLPMAFWIKVACVLVMAPFVATAGLPSNPTYYALLAAQSLLWVVSDVIFYRGINEVGAGVIARILPVTTFATFFLWFAIDWPLASAYVANPAHSLAIMAILGLSVFFAWQMKDCPVTRKALRAVWFLLFAIIVGSLSTKIITQYAAVQQGVYAYVFFEALMMIAIWLIHYALKRPLPFKTMFGIGAIKSGLTVGVVAAFCVAATVGSFFYTDNPAYASAIRYLDSVMIFFYYRATSRPNQGHIWAGFGMVACAAALVIIKAPY